MFTKEFIVVSNCGDYHLGVDTFADAVFAATGDYSMYEFSGYPSVIGDWVENAVDVKPYNSNWDEDMVDIIEDIYPSGILKVYQNIDGKYKDITGIVVEYIEYTYEDFTGRSIREKCNAS